MVLKNIFIVLMNIVLGGSLYAQNAIYSEAYNLNTLTRPKTTAPDRTVSCYDENILYSVGSRAAVGSTEMNIYAFDVRSRKTEVLKIRRTKELKKLFNDQVEAIAHLRNKLVLIAFDNIYIFSRSEKQEFHLRKTIKNNGSFVKMYPLNESEVLCYVNYQFHPLDEDHQHTWARLNLDRDSLGREYYFGTENVQFSSMPNEWISTYKGLIAYAHTTDYKIRFYNSEFQLIDSINTEALKTNQSKLPLIPDGTDYSMEELSKIGAGDDTLLTRIEKIFLLDSANLLVVLKQPRTHYLKYDIWKKADKRWIMVKSQSLPGYYENGAAYTKANNEISGFFGNYSGLTYAGNNDFYFIYYPFTENPVSKNFDYQRDYYDVVNELTRKNQLYYGVKKLKIRTD